MTPSCLPRRIAMPHPLRPPPTALRPAVSRPGAARRPLAWRLLADDSEPPQGAQARDRSLALVEAALLLADEPLSPRRLAALAGLADAAEAKRSLQRLRELYQADG